MEPSQARQRMILLHDRMAIRMADSIWENVRHRGVDREDLRQAARLGLTAAAERYDPTLGEFGPFATKYVHGHVLDCLRHSVLNSLPPSLRSKFNYKRGVEFIQRMEAQHEHEVEIHLREILESLTDDERTILIEGRDRENVRGRLGLSRHQYEKIRQSAMSKLRSKLGHAC